MIILSSFLYIHRQIQAQIVPRFLNFIKKSLALLPSFNIQFHHEPRDSKRFRRSSPQKHMRKTKFILIFTKGIINMTFKIIYKNEIQLHRPTFDANNHFDTIYAIMTSENQII